MATLSSQHHSFDILLAFQHGIEEAILIHHFQHWIRYNKKLCRNFLEGRTWTYQTYNEIAAHFPYLSPDKVRYAIKNLINKKILISGNFNTREGDNTKWFAFEEEDKFIGEVPMKYEDLVNLPGVWENSQGSGKIPRALPHTNTHTLTDTEKEKERNKETEKVGGEPPSPPSASPPPSPSAMDLYVFFLGELRKRNPEFKEPNRKKWLKDIDLLLRVDQRDLDKAKELIVWASTQKYWKKACLSPKTLREKYDEMLMQKQAEGEQSAEFELLNANRKHVSEIQKKYPDKVRGLKVFAKYVTRDGTGKDVSLNLPQETFRTAFFSLFRGGYEG
jgi:hypothetical protein